MPYIGKQPANVPVTADDIPNDSITAAKIVDAAITIDDIGPNAVGNSEMADDAIGLNELSATGTTNSSTFLRGDNSWAVPPTTDISGKLNLSGGAMTGAITTNSTFDGVDIATRDAVLTSTTTTANAALPKAGGTMTGTIAGFTSIGIDDNADATAITINSSEQVGIGTTSINRGQLQIASSGNVELHLTGSGQTGASDGMTITANSSEGNIWLRENGYFRIATNNSERLRIDSSGKVGIGTTSPTNNLHIKSTGNTDQNFIQVEDSDGNKAMRLLSTSSTGDNELIVYNTSGSGKVKLNSNGHSYFDGGNLGIGTTSPERKLHVYSTEIVQAMIETNGSSARLAFESSGSNTNAGNLIAVDANDMWFRTNNTERMRINSSGNVGIGITPVEKLHLAADSKIQMSGSGNSGNLISQNGSGTTQISLQGGAASQNFKFSVISNTSSYFTFNTNTGEQVRITDNGLTFNGDTATANALDDYEEGTYAFTITGGTSGSMTPRSGYNHFAYTKIGRLVTVQGRFETSGSHTASGQLRVSLPFSSHDGQSHSAQGAGVVSIYRAGANFNNLRAVVFNNSNYFVFYYNEGGTGDSDATVEGSNVDATMEGSLSITYMT